MNGNGHGIKRIAALSCAFAVALSLGGCSLLTPTRAEVQPEQRLTKLTEPAIATKGVLTVGLAANDAPQVMNDSEGQLEGYTVDVARALAKRLGLDVAFITDAEPEEVGGAGAPDVYLGAVSEDATGDVSISGDLLEDAPALFGKVEGAPSTLAAEQLSGATIAVQRDSVSQDVLTKCGILAEQKAYSNVNECFDAVASGEVQYAACDATAGGYLSRVYADVAFVGTLDTVTTYGIAMRTVNTDLVEAVTDALNELAGDGTLDAIHMHWYGSLPMSMSDSMVSGITTSAEREAAEEAERAAEEEAEENEDATEEDEVNSEE